MLSQGFSARARLHQKMYCKQLIASKKNTIYIEKVSVHIRKKNKYGAISRQNSMLEKHLKVLEHI
jgi:hypothetical protein